MGLTKQTYCHKNNLKSTINTDSYSTKKSTKTPLQEFCKGVFYFIKDVYQFRTLALSRSA